MPWLGTTAKQPDSSGHTAMSLILSSDLHGLHQHIDLPVRSGPKFLLRHEMKKTISLQRHNENLVTKAMRKYLEINIMTPAGVERRITVCTTGL